MRKALVLSIAVTIFAITPVLRAQQLTVYLNSLNGITAGNSFDGGSRGGSLGLNFTNTLHNDLKWLGGVELNTVSWGNNAVINLGIVYGKDFAPKWSWSVSGLTQQGVALFKPNALYSFGLSALGGIDFRINDKSSIGLSTGLRWYNCPEYSKYSLISSYLDFPVQLSYRINLKK